MTDTKKTPPTFPARGSSMQAGKAARLVGHCYCHCGRLRIATPSGAVCEDHMIVPGVTAKDIHDAPLAKRLVEATIAEKVSRTRYTIRGEEYTRCIKRAPTEFAALLSGDRLVFCGFLPLEGSGK